jgi:hypothetical protein
VRRGRPGSRPHTPGAPARCRRLPSVLNRHHALCSLADATANPVPLRRHNREPVPRPHPPTRPCPRLTATPCAGWPGVPTPAPDGIDIVPSGSWADGRPRSRTPHGRARNRAGPPTFQSTRPRPSHPTLPGYGPTARNGRVGCPTVCASPARRVEGLGSSWRAGDRPITNVLDARDERSATARRGDGPAAHVVLSGASGRKRRAVASISMTMAT